MPKDSRPWIKVSVDMWRHPKITALSLPQRWALIGLWSISMEYLTDGVVDAAAARRQGITARVYKALADAGVCRLSDDEQTIYLHDYLEHQQSKAQIEAATNQRRSAGRKGGQAKAKNRSGPLSESLSGPLSEPSSETPSDTRSRETRFAIEGEEERDLSTQVKNPPLRNVSASASDARGAATTFSDGTPIGPEPPPDAHTDGANALAVVRHLPILPGENPRTPERAHAGDSARQLVRLHVPDGSGIPSDVRGQLADRVQRLMNDRSVNGADIGPGLELWMAATGVGPGLLPRFVADAARQRLQRTPTGIGKPSQKARAAVDIAEELIRQNRKGNPQ